VKEQINTDVTIISNARHLEAIQKTDLALQKVESDIKQNLSPELLSVDIRSALYYLGEITGTIANEDILENIFSKFCIGK
ncbi:MAG: tRNA uridine-5-carboxymethylaminomethyl(34) synthesis GTPase MnmE, partial [Bacteroidota bacterium]|nr:tRNA uridine-5-carboxymethylaminomethyl(34) synthesis GTPase MnmE [Bacteroidota bacterium]